MRIVAVVPRFAAALLLTAALHACGRPDPSVQQAAGGPSAGAETPASSGSGLTIKGSDTMVHLVSKWAENYQNAHSEAHVSVTGGGSGTGITALINGTTDICMASRDITPEELEQARAKGVTAKETTVALDGIAVIVNPKNAVAHLSMAQLKDIFTGKVSNWSAVGGPEESIGVVSRESSSGTYVFFQEHVLQKEDYAAGARLLPANSTIVQTVSEEEWAIGYVGLGYAENAKDRVKAIPVGDSAEAAIAATVENVLSGSYPIARALHFYAVEPVSSEAAGFIEYCLSPAGQQVVQEEGYVPAPNAAAPAASESAPEPAPGAAQGSGTK